MSVNLHTEVCRLLSIQYPVFQAGLAGGPGTAALTAAVSAAGGFGTLGAAYLAPEQLRAAIREIRAATDRPFGVNLFVPQANAAKGRTELPAEEERRILSLIDRVRADLGLEPADRLPDEPRTIDFGEQMAVLLEERVPAVGTTFGVLPAEYRKEAADRGMKVITMVTTVDEAEEAQRQGADLLVAQGAEAGGHRGTFDVGRYPGGANVGTFALVPQVVDRVRIPVIAAGGVMDGRGLAAALLLGAQGVQLGTRFLTSLEAGTAPAYREALKTSKETDTEVTTAFSGRPARGVDNAFMRMWRESGLAALPFPLQNALTREIRTAAAAQGRAEYLSLWSGQGLRQLGNGEPAGEIVRRIAAEAENALRGTNS
ncbi:NAD(P)H-dependent flavin oxidoreductase [Cohnella caldifontis]|uniref:NAD(P)H-dependent flavin oxidoreductase n=1 Tax=Cohnella caldifontis TaxID=3027471 RepID=UPI0023EB04DA|nr:nitronate monooxygenase [Cohnella sp. YIM B05605]